MDKEKWWVTIFYLVYLKINMLYLTLNEIESINAFAPNVFSSKLRNISILEKFLLEASPRMSYLICIKF
jgi:aspartate carbamoyltransferase regulatory subunit